MKQARKNLLTFTALLSALIMLVSACATATPQPSATAPAASATVGGSTATASAASSVQPTAALDPVSLRIVAPGPPQKDQALVDDALSKYLKDKINATIKMDQYDWSAWNDKNNLIIASGEDCDLIFTAPWCDYNTNMANGAYIDLTDLIQKYGQDILKSSYSWIVTANKVNGKLYAIPSYQMLAQSRGFIIRKDLADKYGPSVNFQIKDVNTPEDLEPLLKVIKENEPNIIPYYGIPSKLLSWLGPWDRQGQFETTTINCYDATPQYLNFYATDYYKTAMATARRWYLAGYTNKDIATTQEDPQAEMKAGKVFCFSMETNETSADVVSRGTGYPIEVMNVIKPIISTSLVQGCMWAIPRQSKNPERAMMLLDVMHSDKNVENFLVYGIEGTHYVKKGGNVISLAPGIDAANDPYMNQEWEFGNQALLFDLDTDTPNAAQRLADFNNSAIKTPSLGFTYDPTNMKNEIAALTNVASEFDPELSSGTVDPDKDGTYNKFLAKLTDAGIDKLLADQNSQLETWLKANGK